MSYKGEGYIHVTADGHVLLCSVELSRADIQIQCTDGKI